MNRLRAALGGRARIRARRRDAGGHGTGGRPALVDLDRVLRRICLHARAGYEEPYKREVIGILLGRLSRRGHVVGLRAVAYDTPFRTRTRCDPHPRAFRRRALRLASSSKLRYLGCYHSHPEEAGSRSWAPTREDRAIFLEDPDALVEVVVSVSVAGRTSRVPRQNPRRNRDGSLSYWNAGFHYRLAAETKLEGAHRRRARAGPSGRPLPRGGRP